MTALAVNSGGASAPVVLTSRHPTPVSLGDPCSTTMQTCAWTTSASLPDLMG